jgi:hypothetical protein
MSGGDEPEWKGEFDKASWLSRYAEYMMQAGMEPYEAECWALNAWDASDDDCDPEEIASADLAYSAEDSR